MNLVFSKKENSKNRNISNLQYQKLFRYRFNHGMFFLSEMHQFSLEYLRCVNCYGTLEIEILEQSYETEEGFLDRI
jgi:hypothetical protein